MFRRPLRKDSAQRLQKVSASSRKRPCWLANTAKPSTSITGSAQALRGTKRLTPRRSRGLRSKSVARGTRGVSAGVFVTSLTTSDRVGPAKDQNPRAPVRFDAATRDQRTSPMRCLNVTVIVAAALRAKRHRFQRGREDSAPSRAVAGCARKGRLARSRRHAWRGTERETSVVGSL